ncbi:efflux RND transporter periplasmic adaptor subunit [Fontimonas sp. SYSU GA230001]|uniref:efflux RND transporter periplasmic adaptor subunit n=1 Tax=Fontimonas sp. SYSU GA230001 TaxID=3142450 RepID=UPI0032B31CEA
MRHTGILALLVGGAALAAFAARQWIVPPLLDVVQPTRGPAVEAVYATGQVEPTLEIRIAPRVAGRLVELLADEGDTVAKGQLLARLEDQDLQASAAELAARSDYAAAAYRRALDLRRSGAVSQDSVDRARAERDAADAALRRAREQLGYMRLLAPENGQIIRRDGEIGEFIAVNQTLFHMAGVAPLRITAEVDEEDIPRVHPGLPALIRADAFADRVFHGTVEQVTPRGDAVARSYRVRIALAADTPLRIGMTAETNIVLAERQDALLVPTSALIDGHVWVVADGHARRRTVRAGVVGPQRSEILDGLNGDEWLVLSPPEDLADGRRIRTRQAAAAAP